MENESSPLPARVGNRARLLYAKVRHRVGKVLFERRFDAETSGKIELEQLGLESETEGGRRLYYQPSQWLSLRTALSPGEVGPEDVFIDIGSGLGRVVLQAAEYPFKRVRGIELSEELNEVAKRNVERNRARLICQDIELTAGDALEHGLPDDVTVAFLHNPVRGDLFRQLVDCMIASVDRNPRPLRIIYNNPTEHEMLMRTGRVRVVKERPPKWLRQALQMTSIRLYVMWPQA